MSSTNTEETVQYSESIGISTKNILISGIIAGLFVGLPFGIAILQILNLIYLNLTSSIIIYILLGLFAVAISFWVLNNTIIRIEITSQELKIKQGIFRRTYKKQHIIAVRVVGQIVPKSMFRRFILSIIWINIPNIGGVNLSLKQRQKVRKVFVPSRQGNEVAKFIRQKN